LYYLVGLVNTDESVTYTRAEAIRLAVESDGMTFWSEPPADALFADSPEPAAELTPE
jgi:hypothetical protein